MNTPNGKRRRRSFVAWRPVGLSARSELPGAARRFLPSLLPSSGAGPGLGSLRLPA